RPRPQQGPQPGGGEGPSLANPTRRSGTERRRRPPVRASRSCLTTSPKGKRPGQARSRIPPLVRFGSTNRFPGFFAPISSPVNQEASAASFYARLRNRWYFYRFPVRFYSDSLLIPVSGFP